MAGREAGREVRGRDLGRVRAGRAGTSTPAVETPAAALARLYDLDTGDQDADLDLYLALAGRTEGPILELMAGSGRVAVPLAAAGCRVVAVDLDAAMLGRARAAARADGREAARRLETVHADIDGYRHARAGRFGLALIALGSLLLLPDRPAQRRAVRRSPTTSRPGASP